MKLKYYFYIILLFLFFSFVFSCGVTQHNLIAHRALSWFNPSTIVGDGFSDFLIILQNNQDSFQAGAAFPDWGYACADDGDASEQAHWPPFTLTYTEYFLNKCGNIPSNWTTNGDCQKLVAFLFGIVSHQVADVLWHDLAIVSSSQQGFIQAMANSDFNGDFSNAHSIADAGGEFIIAKEFDLSFIQREWYVPANDISAIYKILQKDISVETLIECNLLLYAEVHAVKYGGELLYPYAARESVFLEDQQLNYWMGGMDDNSVWTLWCWYDYLMFWLTSDGNSIEQYPLCLAQQPLFGNCPACNSIKPPTVAPEIKKLTNNLLNRNDSFTITKIQDNGYKFSTNDNILNIIKEDIDNTYNTYNTYNNNNNNNNILSSDLSSSCNNFINNIPLYQGSINNSYVGWSFSSGDLNHDGINDLVIGAPGYGNYGNAQQGGIYYLYGNSNSSFGINNILSTIPNLIGNNTHDRFGWASEIIDINQDGWNDLIVSSPSNSAYNLTYKGIITIFLGNSQGLLSYSSSLIISTQLNYTNLGYYLSKYDFNSDGYLDLIISAPYAGNGNSSPQQKGKVYILLSNNNTFISGNNIDIDSTSVLILEGESSNNLFGSHIDIYPGDSNQEPLLFIGAPYYQSSNYEIGSIYAYNIKQLMKGHSQSSSLVFQIIGEDLWDQTGFSFSIGSLQSHSLVLGLSTPGRKTGATEEQFGAVFFYDISSLKGIKSLYQIENIIVLQGDEKYAKFGHSCIYDKQNSSWWISQPKRPYNIDTPESGVLYKWNSNTLPSHPKDPIDSSNECWYSNIGKIRFGESIHFVDINGNGITDVIIGSPRYSKNLTGAFSIILR